MRKWLLTGAVACTAGLLLTGWCCYVTSRHPSSAIAAVWRTAQLGLRLSPVHVLGGVGSREMQPHDCCMPVNPPHCPGRDVDCPQPQSVSCRSEGVPVEAFLPPARTEPAEVLKIEQLDPVMVQALEKALGVEEAKFRCADLEPCEASAEEVVEVVVNDFTGEECECPKKPTGDSCCPCSKDVKEACGRCCKANKGCQQARDCDCPACGPCCVSACSAGSCGRCPCRMPYAGEPLPECGCNHCGTECVERPFMPYVEEDVVSEEAEFAVEDAEEAETEACDEAEEAETEACDEAEEAETESCDEAEEAETEACDEAEEDETESCDEAEEAETEACDEAEEAETEACDEADDSEAEEVSEAEETVGSDSTALPTEMEPLPATDHDPYYHHHHYPSCPYMNGCPYPHHSYRPVYTPQPQPEPEEEPSETQQQSRQAPGHLPILWNQDRQTQQPFVDTLEFRQGVDGTATYEGCVF